jgi:hypothetical protein
VYEVESDTDVAMVTPIEHHSLLKDFFAGFVVPIRKERRTDRSFASMEKLEHRISIELNASDY